MSLFLIGYGQIYKEFICKASGCDKLTGQRGSTSPEDVSEHRPLSPG